MKTVCVYVCVYAIFLCHKNSEGKLPKILLNHLKQRGAKYVK